VRGPCNRLSEVAPGPRPCIIFQMIALGHERVESSFEICSLRVVGRKDHQFN
jgi:hypothetical protein